MFPITVSFMLLIAMAFFAYTLANRLGLLRVMEGSDERYKNIPSRIKSLLVYAIGQKRMMSVKKDFWAGLLHAFIFWGFVVISFRTIMLVGQGFSKDFVLPGFGGALGHFYNLNKDIFTVLVFVGCLFFVGRRLISKPERTTLSLEALPW